MRTPPLLYQGASVFPFSRNNTLDAMRSKNGFDLACADVTYVNAEQNAAGMDSPLPVVGFLNRQTRLHEYRRQIARYMPGNLAQLRSEWAGRDDGTSARDAGG